MGDGNNHGNGQSQIIDALGQTILAAANSEGVL
jgi:hypothetical protein